MRGGRGLFVGLAGSIRRRRRVVNVRAVRAARDAWVLTVAPGKFVSTRSHGAGARRMEVQRAPDVWGRSVMSQRSPMSQRRGVSPQSPTIPLDREWTALQAALGGALAELDAASRELAARERGPCHGGTIELISALTGAPMWVDPDVVEWISRRAMIGPPRSGEPTTAWVVRRVDGAARAIEYRTRVTLLNRALDRLLNSRQIDRGIEVTHGADDDPDFPYRRFFFVDPGDPGRAGPIADGASVLLVCDHGDDPTVHVAPVVKNGRWFLERMPIESAAAQSFCVRVLAGRDVAGVSDASGRRERLAERAAIEGRELDRRAQSPAEIERRRAVSLRFDGDTRLAVDGPALARLTPPSTLTIEARVLLEGLPGDEMCVLSKGDAGARDYHLSIRRDGAAVFMLHTADGASIDLRTPPGAALPGRWHQIACVADVVRMRVALFVDGAERAAAPLVRRRELGGAALALPVAGLRGSAAPLRFGRAEPDEPASRLRGHLDEVRVWNAARGPSDLRGGLYRYAAGDEPGLVGCWRLGDREQGVVPDITGGGNVGHAGR